MIHLKGVVTIAQPSYQVFQFVANYENDLRWRIGVTSLVYTTPMPVDIGSRATELMAVYGQRLETVTEVVEYELGRKIVSKSLSGPTPVVATRIVEADGAGCRVTYQLDVDESGVVLFRMLRPLLKRLQQAQMDKMMLQLKQVLESSTERV